MAAGTGDAVVTDPVLWGGDRDRLGPTEPLLIALSVRLVGLAV